MSENQAEEAKRLAQQAMDRVTEHERRCLRMWNGLAILLLLAIVGFLLTGRS